jgi:hypothetical protein
MVLAIAEYSCKRTLSILNSLRGEPVIAVLALLEFEQHSIGHQVPRMLATRDTGSEISEVREAALATFGDNRPLAVGTESRQQREWMLVAVVEDRGIETLDEPPFIAPDDPLDYRSEYGLDRWRELMVRESAIDVTDAIPRAGTDIQTILSIELAGVCYGHVY